MSQYRCCTCTWVQWPSMAEVPWNPMSECALQVVNELFCASTSLVKDTRRYNSDNMSARRLLWTAARAVTMLKEHRGHARDVDSPERKRMKMMPWAWVEGGSRMVEISDQQAVQIANDSAANLFSRFELMSSVLAKDTYRKWLSGQDGLEALAQRCMSRYRPLNLRT